MTDNYSLFNHNLISSRNIECARVYLYDDVDDDD